MNVVSSKIAKLQNINQKQAKELALIKQIALTIKQSGSEKLDDESRVRLILKFTDSVATVLKPWNSDICMQDADFPWMHLVELASVEVEQLKLIATQKNFADYMSALHKRLTVIISTAEAVNNRKSNHVKYLTFIKLNSLKLEKTTSEMNKALDLLNGKTALEKSKKTNDLSQSQLSQSDFANVSEGFKSEFALKQVRNTLKHFVGLQKKINQIMLKGENELEIDCVILKTLGLYLRNVNNIEQGIKFLCNSEEHCDFGKFSRQLIEESLKCALDMLSIKQNHGYHKRLQQMEMTNPAESYLAGLVGESLEKYIRAFSSGNYNDANQAPLSMALCTRFLKEIDSFKKSRFILNHISSLLKLLKTSKAEDKYNLKKHIESLQIILQKFVGLVEQSNGAELIKANKQFKTLKVLSNKIMSELDDASKLDKLIKYVGSVCRSFNAQAQNVEVVLVKAYTEEEFENYLSSAQYVITTFVTALGSTKQTAIIESNSKMFQEKTRELFDIIELSKGNLKLLSCDTVGELRDSLTKAPQLLEKAAMTTLASTKVMNIISALTKDDVVGAGDVENLFNARNLNWFQKYIEHLNAGSDKKPNFFAVIAVEDCEQAKFMTLKIHDMLDQISAYRQQKRLKAKYILSKTDYSNLKETLPKDMMIGEFVQFIKEQKNIQKKQARQLNIH